MNADVLASFEILLETINKAKTQLANEVRDLIVAGQDDEAKWLLDNTSEVKKLVEELREYWERLVNAPNEPPPSNHKMPQRAYRVPILEALEELGGRGQVQKVLDIVLEKMKDRLTEYDLEPLPGSDDIRWHKTANWERYNMVREGLLRGDSPRGVWEITAKGRAYLERARQDNKSKDKERY